VTARNRSETLVKELASLFVKYNLRDWQPVIDELLEGGPRNSKIAHAIEELGSVRPKAKRGAGKRAKAVSPALKLRPTHKAILKPLWQALLDRKVLGTARDLRSFHLAAGVKAAFPASRQRAIELLIHHLNQLSEPDFQATMTLLSRHRSSDESGFSEDYRRWFEIIFKGEEPGSRQ
jgi:hypothetical protein